MLDAARAWQQQAMKSQRQQCLLVWCLLNGLCLVIGGLLALFLFSTLVDSIIASKVQIIPGSEVAEAWMNPPVKPMLKIYYFNVTNPEVKVKTLNIEKETNFCPTGISGWWEVKVRGGRALRLRGKMGEGGG